MLCYYHAREYLLYGRYVPEDCRNGNIQHYLCQAGVSLANEATSHSSEANDSSEC